MLQTVLSLAVSLFVISVAISSYYKYILDFSITQTELIIFNAIYGVSGLLYNLLYLSYQYVHKQNEDRLAGEKILTEAIEAEVFQFKNEVNPNLLYDSLESLITLVHHDKEQAEDYIDHLSLVYRYILSHRKIELSTVDDEIKATQNVIFLLNQKFNNQISLEIGVPKDLLLTPMVPATLPNCIECIIRNTIINKNNPLKIELEAELEDGYLVVQSKMNDKLILDEAQKEIFHNIQTSYGYYSEKPVVSVKAFDTNYIKVPILELLQDEIVV